MQGKVAETTGQAEARTAVIELMTTSAAGTDVAATTAATSSASKVVRAAEPAAMAVMSIG